MSLYLFGDPEDFIHYGPLFFSGVYFPRYSLLMSSMLIIVALSSALVVLIGQLLLSLIPLLNQFKRCNWQS